MQQVVLRLVTAIQGTGSIYFIWFICEYIHAADVIVYIHYLTINSSDATSSSETACEYIG